MTIPSLRLLSTGLHMQAVAVPWDSESFGVPVAQIESIKVHEPVDAMSQALPVMD